MSGDDLTVALFLVGTGVTLGLSAITSAGWRHWMLLLTLFVAAIASVLAGIAWPWLKGIAPTLKPLLEEVAKRPLAWFILMIAAVVFLHVRSARNFAITPDFILTRKPSESNVFRISNDAESNVVACDHEHTFKAATIDDLRGLTDRHTDVQASALAKDYIGKKMTISGRLENVIRGFDNKFMQVIVLDKFNKTISFLFSNAEAERLSHIPKRSVITVAGRLQRFDVIQIVLEDYELISINEPTP